MNSSGIPQMFSTFSAAPPRDKFLMVQSMIERPWLKTILPPLKVRRLSACRFSMTATAQRDLSDENRSLAVNT